jgi:hypothetical protein
VIVWHFGDSWRPETVPACVGDVAGVGGLIPLPGVLASILAWEVACGRGHRTEAVAMGEALEAVEKPKVTPFAQRSRWVNCWRKRSGRRALWALARSAVTMCYHTPNPRSPILALRNAKAHKALFSFSKRYSQKKEGEPMAGSSFVW